jgi:hypothetical protein
MHWAPKLAAYLKIRGEAGNVKHKNKRVVKIEDQGSTCILVGYKDSHTTIIIACGIQGQIVCTLPVTSLGSRKYSLININMSLLK